mmetsp:Transcript_38582/g.34290  ORF Transcript_38582/g.34290 Transcript_38582/m.34290 type:complete len:88 (-) Transcript_38582:63-326(-)
MRHDVEVPATNFRVYRIKTLSDDVLPTGSSKENLEALFAARVELNKINKYKIIGVLDLKKEDEEPTAQDIIEAPLLYLVYITEVNLE